MREKPLSVLRCERASGHVDAEIEALPGQRLDGRREVAPPDGAPPGDRGLSCRSPGMGALYPKKHGGWVYPAPPTHEEVG